MSIMQDLEIYNSFSREVSLYEQMRFNTFVAIRREYCNDIFTSLSVQHFNIVSFIG